MEKNCLKLIHCCYLTTKTILGLKKYKGNGPKMDFQICESLPFLGPPYHALALNVPSLIVFIPNVPALQADSPSSKLLGRISSLAN